MTRAAGSPHLRHRVGGALLGAGLLVLPACGGGEPEIDPYHSGEMTFIGIVTEHDAYDVTELQVDSADVSLDLVHPVDGGCWDAEPSLRDQATAAKASLLPIGTRVLVVRADDHGAAAFVHLLPAGTDAPDPSPPALSVNEQLVAGGYWEPSGYQIDDDDSDAAAAFAIRYQQELSPAEVRYAPLLIAAGNASKAASVTGYGTCLAEMTRREADLQAWRDQAERDAEEWDRQHSQTHGTCRDGDGDGICYED